MQRKAGWHPDSDRLGERYWNGAAWEGFRVRNRDLGFVFTILIWVYIPIATVWIAQFGDFRHPSEGLWVASVVIGVLALIPIGRSLTQAITITSTAVADRRSLRTRRYRLEQIEDAFLRETGLGGKQLLTLRLRGEKLVVIGNLDDRPERRRACVMEIRGLLPSAPALERSLVRPPYVARALRSARVGDVASGEPLTLLTAASLVYIPRVGSTAVDVFDQGANCLGSVIQVFREQQVHPYGWRVELRDAEERCVFSCTATEAGGSGRFAIREGRDGARLVDVEARDRVRRRWFAATRGLTASGESVGRLVWNPSLPNVTVKDAEGQRVARITSPRGLSQHWVLHMHGAVNDSLRAVALLVRFVLDTPPPRVD
jgi:hypothetical protein